MCYTDGMENYKEILSQNLISLRKSRKLTQLELAEKLNYSDKTISKWENGDAVPDLETLVAIAKFYGVTIDALISEDAKALAQENVRENRQINRNKLIITLLATTGVWLLAILLFINFVIRGQNLWMIFIWAIPCSFIVLLVFNSIWGRRVLQFAIITCLIWTLLLAIHLQFRAYNMWSIYFLGIPLQIATILWSQLKPHKKRK